MHHAFYTDPGEHVVDLLGHPVSLYLILAHAGFVVGWAVTVLGARRHGLAPRRLLLLAPGVYVLAAIGAHLFSVIFDGRWGHFWRHPGHALDLTRGGFVLYGGVAGALVAGVAGARLLRLPFGAVADACAPGTALGLGLGRVGCFLQGCCYGKPTASVFGVEYRNFAVSARPIGVPLHPAALYEAAGLAVIALLTSIHARRASIRDGRTFLLFLALYGLLRFAVELVRADPRGTIAGLPTSQLISLITVPLAALSYAALKRRQGQLGGSE